MGKINIREDLHVFKLEHKRTQRTVGKHTVNDMYTLLSTKSYLKTKINSIDSRPTKGEQVEDKCVKSNFITKMCILHTARVTTN